MREYIKVIPENVALETREKFLSANYDKVFQERNNQFSRQFNKKWQTLPNNDEVYTSYFHKSNYLEKSPEIKQIYEQYIKPIIEKQENRNFDTVEFRCYKMPSGGHFRLHIDEYLGGYGFIWYLSLDWKWDWGGLLLTLNSEQNATVSLPTFNKLIVINHTDAGNIHCVTPVTEYALEPRIMLVGFLK